MSEVDEARLGECLMDRITAIVAMAGLEVASSAKALRLAELRYANPQVREDAGEILGMVADRLDELDECAAAEAVRALRGGDYA